MEALNMLDFRYCGLVLRRDLDLFYDKYDGEPTLFDEFVSIEQHDDERSVNRRQVCQTLGHMAADTDMTDISVTQSFSSIWQQRPLSDSTPPSSPTVSREPFHLGSLSVLDVFVKRPERYEHVAVPLSSDLYMEREEAYVDYIPCPGSGPGSPALSVLSEADLPEIIDEFPKIDDSRPVVTEIEPTEEEKSKAEVAEIESVKIEIKMEERSMSMQPSQTRDWLATVLEKRQQTPENEKLSAALTAQAAFDEEQLKKAVRDQRRQAELCKPRLNKRTRMRSSVPPQSRKKAKNTSRQPRSPPVPEQHSQYPPHQGWTG
ncbi:hypothetical protein B0T20DRAFT_455627 [Sordaria brevicollis]|uniref:Uncharacterized protein n=1 Tax=Sordaria brevicollis TaxID=83679 RepID=A0AAE0P9J4_SORBR|nr:hypothetical protein B0T20DRAFT_455627 [Sordaria brevicollis]